MRDYAATFVGNDYLISQRADEDEKRYSENEMLTSAAEHLVHNAFSDNGIDAYIETTDISFRDSQSHYICIMFESEEDDGDIRRALRGLYESSKTLELVTLTCITHPDWEIRDEAVRSFVEEAIGNACLSDEEEAEASDDTMLCHLTSWFMDDIRDLVQEKLSTAIGECRSDS